MERQKILDELAEIQRRIAEYLEILGSGKIIRLEAAEIRQAGRSTQGVRLVRMEKGDRVAAASVIPETELNGNGGENGQQPLPLQ